MKKEFINELGNTIIVEAMQKDIEGVAGIILSISGPTSTHEDHITKREAEAMRDALSAILS